MVSRRRLLVPALVAALIAVGLSATSAQAALAKVGGVRMISQDLSQAKVRVSWRAVRGATYQVRFAASTRGLPGAAVSPARSASAYSPRLNPCTTSYVQVRAVRGTAVGAWSRAAAVRFRNRQPASPPTISGVGVPDGVRLSWPGVANATRYRVRWNAGPFGKFAGGDAAVGGGWLSGSTRSVTLDLPRTPAFGDKMMGVAYANPVYVQIDANNACKPTAIRMSHYVPVMPEPYDPGVGDNFRMGSYNVELFPDDSTPTRIAGIAKNIIDHSLDVFVLQEASAGTVSALGSRLPSVWRAVAPVRLSGQQIFYRSDRFRLTDDGSFTVPNPKPGANDLVTPWAHLAQVNPASPQSQDLFVVAVHYAENAAASLMTKKHDTGLAASATLAAIRGFNPGDEPIVVAGDMRYHREPFTEVRGYIEAPPTFVRAGFYDAMAALRRTGTEYPSVNGHQVETRSVYGISSRSDYIMLKGFRGSRAYVNGANWRYNGAWVSDHNLIYADLTIPFS